MSRARQASRVTRRTHTHIRSRLHHTHRGVYLGTYTYVTYADPAKIMKIEREREGLSDGINMMAIGSVIDAVVRVQEREMREDKKRRVLYLERKL